MKLVVLHEASEELSAAAIWYERERAGLGAELLAEAGRALKTIAENPTVWPLVTRSRVLRHFQLMCVPNASNRPLKMERWRLAGAPSAMFVSRR